MVLFVAKNNNNNIQYVQFTFNILVQGISHTIWITCIHTVFLDLPSQLARSVYLTNSMTKSVGQCMFAQQISPATMPDMSTCGVAPVSPLCCLISPSSGAMMSLPLASTQKERSVLAAGAHQSIDCRRIDGVDCRRNQ